MPLRGHFHFNVNVMDFMSRLHLPQDDPRAIHPCLISAICLAACSFILPLGSDSPSFTLPVPSGSTKDSGPQPYMAGASPADTTGTSSTSSSAYTPSSSSTSWTSSPSSTATTFDSPSPCPEPPTLSAYEPHFLDLTRIHLTSSLSLCDRLSHFIWASIILGCYYGQVGRVVESYSTMGATVRFAVACGLHRRPYLPSRTTIAKTRDPSKIGEEEGSVNAIDLPDTDTILTDEPNAMWYAIYMTDAAISAGTGLPSSLPVDPYVIRSPLPTAVNIGMVTRSPISELGLL
ncbi:uncharacterized protein EI90DRAFT_310693 [Cantharellus anzutake]|uniref:uncharacterized protein n=1 Tax=Cantharellus anzutake TaxID=1750568 RepID=UPI0019076018|nr:uncharacterized protein EI90DRAFT_310693 [Cantharellus anzutake]KAF8315753.1 hypothetical protein EI90DRAFT_310693 [Cantharellus anzutake]